MLQRLTFVIIYCETILSHYRRCPIQGILSAGILSPMRNKHGMKEDDFTEGAARRSVYIVCHKYWHLTILPHVSSVLNTEIFVECKCRPLFTFGC